MVDLQAPEGVKVEVNGETNNSNTSHIDQTGHSASAASAASAYSRTDSAQSQPSGTGGSFFAKRRKSGLDLGSFIQRKGSGLGAAKAQSWYIPEHEIQFVGTLGKGTEGTVYKALYKGEHVAVKAWPAEEGSQQYEDMLQEINMISRNYTNPEMMHPHIVRFVGVSFAASTKSPLLVEEFMAGGCLNSLIESRKEGAWSKKWRPPRDDVLRWTSHLLQALKHLHTARIIHRDLKPSNVMLSADLQLLKLGDFGLSRTVNSGEEGMPAMTGKTGTFRYMAPEIYMGKKDYDEKADIYSVAMIIWYMATGQRVFAQCQDVLAAHNACVMRFRPKIKDLPVKDLRPLVERAWDHDADKRPSAGWFCTLWLAVGLSHLPSPVAADASLYQASLSTKLRSS